MNTTTLLLVTCVGVVVLVIVTLLVSNSAYVSRQAPVQLPLDSSASSSRNVTVTEHKGRNGYIVRELHGLLTKEECQELMTLAKNQGLEDSSVWSFKTRTGNVYDGTHRRSKQTWLTHDVSDTTEKVSQMSTVLTGIPQSHQESLQIAMYEKNGMFNPHFDACQDEDPSYCEKMNHGAGERRTTLLIYLNDDFEGGETEFVDIGIKIKPETGKGILFYSTYEDETLIPESKHQGCPVISGEKWICTVWSHSKEFKA